MNIGDYKLTIIPTHEFGLDGGAMFGVVPRVLWSKVSPPDEQNRIRLNTNCLLIETATEKVLIETGCGDKYADKARAIYNISRQGEVYTQLEALAGITAADITIVVNTHLHFDHAGGNTRLDETGAVVPTFPNARYLMSRGEYLHANNPLERDRASYFTENWQALEKTGQLELKDDEYEVIEGVTMLTVPGHNRTMQCMRLERAGHTLFNFADLVPTRHHLQPAWLMGYDLYPVETLANKQRLLPEAARENWLCFFIHDPDNPLHRVVETDGKLRAIEVDESEI